MSTEDLTLDLLAYHAFPRLATAVRMRSDAIIQSWEVAVRQTLPAADKLTLQQLKNSLPAILQEIADAFASDQPRDTQELIEGSKSHGTTRFHENYNIGELIVEYRLLRRIIIDQVSEALHEELDTRCVVALNMAIDAILQGGITTFTAHLQQEIKASAEIQAKYLSFLSHDLRNHLNHATVQLQLLAARLARAPEYADSAESIQSIKRAILHTTAGMDQLLQAERLRHHAVDFDGQTVDLRLLLSEVAQQCLHQAQSKGLRLEVEVPDEALITSDEGLLTLVLQNLLGNAVKYSSRGTVKISAHNLSNGDATGWVLSVSDQGPGIAPHNLTNLFDAFKRGDTYGKPGVGLGLTIAVHSARLLGGELEVESELNVGSTFRLVLPNRDASAA
ncbi:sensor histidine kinase [Nitrosovibrio tenuis]|uniref:histidine kinase n=1 Tax=Nitrosovibrio tenuis TaxID=1233 RepID=A0A1H7N9U1_9PROT|nr:sensor histidine kinase [Nitrosovibrio tenuis]SEL20240.1 histidine kinase [Nitrosovibrio tenuis]